MTIESPAVGEVWVRQSDGRAVLVEDVTAPDPQWEPDPGPWGRSAARYVPEARRERFRRGQVDIRPVQSCTDPSCPKDNPKWHDDCPPGFHKLRGRHTQIRLDRWHDSFGLLRRAA